MAVQVGLWAERNVPRMSMPQLAAFEEVLDIENPDLFKWLTGQEPAPDALRDNASFTVRTEPNDQTGQCNVGWTILPPTRCEGLELYS